MRHLYVSGAKDVGTICGAKDALRVHVSHASKDDCWKCRAMYRDMIRADRDRWAKWAREQAAHRELYKG